MAMIDGLSPEAGTTLLSFYRRHTLSIATEQLHDMITIARHMLVDNTTTT